MTDVGRCRRSFRYKASDAQVPYGKNNSVCSLLLHILLYTLNHFKAIDDP